MQTSVTYRLLKSFLIFSILALLGACASNQHPDVLEQYKYTPSTSVNQNVDQTIEQAKQQNKLAMIVLGAQWCHDSVGLSAKFSSEGMQRILNEKYVTQFVDVGYLEDRREITQRFGYPTYFGTPTVLIIEPNTETLLNYNEVSKWQAADSVPFEEYLSYFGSLTGGPKAQSSSKQSPRVNAQVDAFERQQVERLYQAYAVLGPLLKADEDGTLKDKQAFYEKWKAVYKFRSQLQADLVSLKDLVNSKKQNVDKSRLIIPTYPPFEWEVK